MKRLIIFIVIFFSVRTALGFERIVSLAPQATEILYSLGLGQKIVGVTTFCNRPEDAKKKPKIGGMSNPSLEAIIALKPDIVVMTTDGNPEWVEERLRDFGIRTYVIRARRIAELPGELREIGKALGVREHSEELAKEIEREIASYRGGHSRGRAIFIIWPEPLIVAGPGTAIDDAMRLVGLKNIAEGAAINYPKYSVEETIKSDPEIIIIGSAPGMEGYSKGLLKKLSRTTAVKRGNVFFVSDNLYRLGPRIIDGIRELDDISKRVKR